MRNARHEYIGKLLVFGFVRHAKIGMVFCKVYGQLSRIKACHVYSIAYTTVPWNVYSKGTL